MAASDWTGGDGTSQQAGGWGARTERRYHTGWMVAGCLAKMTTQPMNVGVARHAPPPTWSVSVLPCATPHLVSQCAAMRHPPPGQSVCWHCSTSTKKPHLLGTSTLPSQRAGIVQPVHQFCHRRHHDEAVLAQLRLHGRALAGGSAQGGTVGVRRGKVVHRVVQGWYRGGTA